MEHLSAIAQMRAAERSGTVTLTGTVIVFGSPASQRPCRTTSTASRTCCLLIDPCMVATGSIVSTRSLTCGVGASVASMRQSKPIVVPLPRIWSASGLEDGMKRHPFGARSSAQSKSSARSRALFTAMVSRSPAGVMPSPVHSALMVAQGFDRRRSSASFFRASSQFRNDTAALNVETTAAYNAIACVIQFGISALSNMHSFRTPHPRE